MCTCPRRPRGFTLVELMLALAVVTVLVSLGVPQVGRQMARWKLQSAAEHLAGDLADARHDAVRLGQDLQLNVQRGSAWCWSVSVAPACPCDAPQPCQRKRVSAERFGSVAIDEAASFTFVSTADARPASQRIALSNAHGERLQVTLTPLGHARICAVAGSWAGYPRC